MISQSWSCIEYLIPTYSTMVLLLHTFTAKNLVYLIILNQILSIKMITVVFNLCNFLNIMVSQGSVSMLLTCGGICNDHFVEKFVQSLAVKGF